MNPALATRLAKWTMTSKSRCYAMRALLTLWWWVCLSGRATNNHCRFPNRDCHFHQSLLIRDGGTYKCLAKLFI